LLLAAGVIGAANAGWYRSHDFYALYTGARMTALGADPYDEVAWCAATEAVTPSTLAPNGAPVCVTRYAYPRWTALAMLPFGLLPLPEAASLWLAFSIGATVLGARWCWLAVGGSARSAPVFAALVFGAQPFWLLVGGGQIGGVLLAGLGLSLWLLRTDRTLAAGAALAILTLKPNVLGLYGIAFVVRAATRRLWRFIAGLALALLVLFAATLSIDPAWPAKLVAEIVGRQTAHSAELATAWGLAARELGVALAAPVLIVAVVLVVLWLARGIPTGAVAFGALAVPLGLFATPYAWSYDFVPLALPWAFVVAIADRSTPVTRRTLLLALIACASLLPWVLYVLAFQRGAETVSAIVPALTAIVAAAAVRVDARA
jgi:hypothetical protein